MEAKDAKSNVTVANVKWDRVVGLGCFITSDHTPPCQVIFCKQWSTLAAYYQQLINMKAMP
jgi:hypothetical protein